MARFEKVLDISDSELNDNCPMFPRHTEREENGHWDQTTCKYFQRLQVKHLNSKSGGRGPKVKRFEDRTQDTH